MQDYVRTQGMTAGGAIFARLRKLGVDYVFANSGTDFPPVIEGLAEASAKKIKLPEAVVIPHEHAAVGMAHGYYLATGQAQAVMLHTNVGLSNGATAAINAQNDHVPMYLMSGRTPVMEQDRFGARTVPIGWGQEMRDQTALVREIAKWDYELRFPEQIVELLDRAHGIANSTPKGPVYLSLPREVLCELCPDDKLAKEPSMAPARSAPDPAAIKEVAKLLASAKSPLIIAQRGAGSKKSFQTFKKLVSDWAIPVCHYWCTQLILASDHKMNVGSNPAPWIETADVILVLDGMAPWWPDKHKPRDNCPIIQLGPDPLFSQKPVRNFRSDISIAGETEDIVQALATAMRPMLKTRKKSVSDRFEKIAKTTAAIRREVRKNAEMGSGQGMSKAWVSLCLSNAIKKRDATVFSELGCILDPMSLKAHNSWYEIPYSGGLGWSFPASLGYQLADRNKLVFATMGDGSYLFSNPTVCHQIAESLELPLITLILNNREWGAVRKSVLSIYPDGYAAKANEMPLTSLKPSPDFTLTGKASRAHSIRVDSGDQLPDALDDAIAHWDKNKSQVLLDLNVSP